MGNPQVDLVNEILAEIAYSEGKEDWEWGCPKCGSKRLRLVGHAPCYELDGVDSWLTWDNVPDDYSEVYCPKCGWKEEL